MFSLNKRDFVIIKMTKTKVSSDTAAKAAADVGARARASSGVANQKSNKALAPDGATQTRSAKAQASKDATQAPTSPDVVLPKSAKAQASKDATQGVEKSAKISLSAYKASKDAEAIEASKDDALAVSIASGNEDVLEDKHPIPSSKDDVVNQRSPPSEDDRYLAYSSSPLFGVEPVDYEESSPERDSQAEEADSKDVSPPRAQRKSAPETPKVSRWRCSLQLLLKVAIVHL